MLRLPKVVLVMLVIGLFLNLCGLLARAQAADYQITDIEVKELEEEVQVLITSDGPLKHKAFGLEDPPRVRIFLPGGVLTLKEEKMVFREGLIKRIEASQYDTRPNIVQIDVYLAYATSFEVTSEENLLTLSIVRRVEPIPKEIAKEAKRHYKLGKKHYKREEFEKAISEFETALDFAPKLTRANNFILKAKEALRERKKIIALAQKRVKEKMRKEAAQKAQEEREEKIKRHYKLGKGYYQKDELSEAINEFLIVHTLDPEYKKTGKYITKIQDRLAQAAEEKINKEAILRLRAVEEAVKVEAPEKEEEEAPERVKEALVPVPEEGIYELREVRVKELPEETQIIIATDREVEYSSLTLSDPLRLVIDIPQAILVWEEKALVVERGGIQGIRAGQFSTKPPMARIVIDLTQEVEYKISRKQNLISVDIKHPVEEVKREEIVEVKEEAAKIPVPIPEEAEYIIQAGDVLEVSVWQFEELTREVTVRPDGRISYPLAGDLRASGLTPAQLSEKIAKKLTRFIREPQVTINIVEFAGKKVFILGEVTKSGIYGWKGKLRLLEAIMMTGGLTKDADYEKVTVTTEKGRIIPVDLNRLIFQGDISQNVALQSNDTIYVPTTPLAKKKRVFILGEVKTPGRYYIEEGQRLVEALMEAGGYTDDAVIRSIAVVRGDLSNPQVRLVNVSRIIRKGETYRNIPLQSEDIIYVPRRFVVSVNYFIKVFLPSIQAAYYLDSLGILSLR